MLEHDVIIIGGGLAGLTSAIHLRIMGHSVLLIEKKEYPHHKVCGEYVSNEVLPYLEFLGVFLEEQDAVRIDTLQLSTVSGDSVSTKLPLGGIGISRFALDHLLYKKAFEIGVEFMFDSATSIVFNEEDFNVGTKKQIFKARIVIGAFGKRSILDKYLKRDFIARKSSWLGVKAHYRYEGFPENRVALHNFTGGYGGLSKTESGAVNFCYLAHYDSFQKHKDVEDFNRQVISENPFLNAFFKKATPLFDEPLTIAQISFHYKKSVENHILMCGDSAGLIHPLCGNGMAMAIHSAKIASERVDCFIKDASYSRLQLENDYQKAWNNTFRRRLWVGRKAQSILMNKTLSKVALAAAVRSPRLLKTLIERTHGKPINF